MRHLFTSFLSNSADSTRFDLIFYFIFVKFRRFIADSTRFDEIRPDIFTSFSSNSTDSSIFNQIFLLHFRQIPPIRPDSTRFDEIRPDIFTSFSSKSAVSSPIRRLFRRRPILFASAPHSYTFSPDFRCRIFGRNAKVPLRFSAAKTGRCPAPPNAKKLAED